MSGELRAEARATVRFETPPGRQLQVDFSERRVVLGGEPVRVYLFVATLGHSRRIHVRAFRHERQTCWFEGLESAFRAFGGVPAEVLLDNARALVAHHDSLTREIRFNPRLSAFAKHWGFRPRACAPYRARTKGSPQAGYRPVGLLVGYVKRNAIVGRSFASWSAFEAHLEQWTREVADVRLHGTTGEVPIERFLRDEARALRPLAGRPPFQQSRELVRRVQADCCIEVRWQRLQRAVATDRRTGDGRDRRRPATDHACGSGDRRARGAQRAAAAGARSVPLRGHCRLAGSGRDAHGRCVGPASGSPASAR